MIPSTLLKVSTVSTALQCCLHWCSQATVMRPASPLPCLDYSTCLRGSGFAKCVVLVRSSHDTSCSYRWACTHPTSTCQHGVAIDHGGKACIIQHGAGLPASRVFQMLQSGAGPRLRSCDPAQRGAGIPVSRSAPDTDDVRRLVTTSRCSHCEMKQTRKLVPQSPTADVRPLRS